MPSDEPHPCVSAPINHACCCSCCLVVVHRETKFSDRFGDSYLLLRYSVLKNHYPPPLKGHTFLSHVTNVAAATGGGGVMMVVVKSGDTLWALKWQFKVLVLKFGLIAVRSPNTTVTTAANISPRNGPKGPKLGPKGTRFLTPPSPTDLGSVFFLPQLGLSFAVFQKY